jgi:Xaa-Pro aminopeptidase
MKVSKREMQEKERRVRNFIREKGLSAMCFTASKNFAWFTCGGDNHVEITNRQGVGTIVVTPDEKYLVSRGIEAVRMSDEEVEDQGFTVKEVPWHDNTTYEVVRDAAGGGKIGTDVPFPGAEMMDSEFAPIRYSLTPEEIERYREVGKLTGSMLEKTCREIKPGMTEHEIGALMSNNMLSEGVVPAVILIAVDDRIESYRHPIPTDKKLQNYAMLVTCGRKWGLIASATRLVNFGQLPEELGRKHEACTRVDAALIKGTREGADISKLVTGAVEEYTKAGYRDEWRYHHQGGPTGYQTRDFLGTFSTLEKVRPNQAFAWNPSITGTKSEDTIVRTEEGLIILTATGQWPTITHEINGSELTRPDILTV